MTVEPDAADDDRPQGVLVEFPKHPSEMSDDEQRAMARVLFERISAILPPEQPAVDGDTKATGEPR